MNSFDYLPIPHKDDKGNIINTYSPRVLIRLSYKHKLSPFPFSCLLDSGSDYNLFPSYFIQNIGGKLENGKERIITGIGGYEIKAYQHKVKLYIGGKSFETLIDFSHDQQIPLLGRSGFFNYFIKVVFKENKRIIELY